MMSKIKSRFLSVVLALVVFLGCGFMLCACGTNNDQDVQHKVTFMSGTGENATVLGVVYTEGNEEIVLPTIPKRLGYMPNGFMYYVNTDSDGNELTYPREDTFVADTLKNVALTKDLVVYARYAVESYNIHYIVDGVDLSATVEANDIRSLNDESTPTLNAIKYYINETADMQLPSASLAGYVFKGWYLTKESDEIEQKIETIKAGSTGDITLYARFVTEA